MAKTDLPILVAGGGIGGLAVALALARKGLGVHVLESSADFREVGAGIQLGPNVFRMFELLGLTETINASAVFPDNLIMRDGLSGEEVTRVPLGAGFRARFNYPYAVIHRPDLHQAVLDAVRRHAGIRLSSSVKVTGFEEAGERIVVMSEGGTSYEGAALIGRLPHAIDEAELRIDRQLRRAGFAATRQPDRRRDLAWRDDRARFYHAAGAEVLVTLHAQPHGTAVVLYHVGNVPMGGPQ